MWMKEGFSFTTKKGVLRNLKLTTKKVLRDEKKAKSMNVRREI